jgi:hypothetical protein
MERASAPAAMSEARQRSGGGLKLIRRGGGGGGVPAGVGNKYSNN